MLYLDGIVPISLSQTEHSNEYSGLILIRMSGVTCKTLKLEHIIQLGDKARFFCSFSLLRPGPDNTIHQNFLRSCKLKPAQSENSTTALLGAKRNLKVWTYNLENFDWLKSLKTI